MKYIFWVSVDDVLKDFIIGNKMLQYISQHFELVAMCSGEKSHEWMSKYYRCASVFFMENSLQAKGDEFIRRFIQPICVHDYVVRVDMDAIIMNPIWLLKRIEENVDPKKKILAGNPPVFEHESHIRGGCNVTTGVTFQQFCMIMDGNPMAYDEAYTRSVVVAGGEILPLEIFEINNEYTGKCPVWHPDKSPMIEDQVEYLAARYKIFEQQMGRLS